MKAVAVQFGSNTTAHGFSNLVAADEKIIKGVWIFICSLCWGLFLWQGITFIQKYYEFQVDYRIAESYKKLMFPAVTVCNINPIRQSMLNEVGSELDELGFFNIENNTTPESDLKQDVYVEESVAHQPLRDYDPEFKQRARLKRTMNRLTSEVRVRLGHQKTDFIQECTFDGRMCSESDFVHVLNGKYGNCFSFNTGHNNTNMMRATSPGASHGLQLTLFIEENEYLLGVTESTGAVVFAHPHSVVPFPEEQGIEVPPGFMSALGVQMKQMNRLGGMYGECTNGDDIDIWYDGYGYSAEACVNTCYQRSLIGECDCFDATKPNKYESLPVCDNSTNGLECQAAFKKKFIETNIVGCEPRCPQPCLDETYSTMLSMSKWPSDTYYDEVLTRLSRRSFKIDEKDSAEATRRNLIRLKVYYTDFNFESITERPALDGVALLSNLGGLMGLYIGASVISLFEFIEFLVAISRLMLKKGKDVSLEKGTELIKKCNIDALANDVIFTRRR
ncbi:epithelial sodium channel subunit beta-like [Glandiceps talaboti]